MFRIHHISESLRAHRAGRGPASRPTRRNRRRRRGWAVEALEDRTLLSTFTVNSLADSPATGTLRWAITQADGTTGNNTINFSVAGTITLNSALPDLSNTTGLTDIEGPGAASLTVARSNATGTPNFRIFTIDTNVQAKLVGLTITNGLSGGDGGGIDNLGTLTITNSNIFDNSASGAAGGVANSGTLAVANSSVTYNLGFGGQPGGGINNAGTLTVTSSTITHNSGFAGGGIASSGTATILDSNISANGPDPKKRRQSVRRRLT
jgi:hypothetical protein